MKDFGGSAKVARELYNMLQPENADFVSEGEMRERLDDVLKLYLKKKDDDKSGWGTNSWTSYLVTYIFFPEVLILTSI